MSSYEILEGRAHVSIVERKTASQHFCSTIFTCHISILVGYILAWPEATLWRFLIFFVFWNLILKLVTGKSNFWGIKEANRRYIYNFQYKKEKFLIFTYSYFSKLYIIDFASRNYKILKILIISTGDNILLFRIFLFKSMHFVPKIQYQSAIYPDPDNIKNLLPGCNHILDDIKISF